MTDVSPCPDCGAAPAWSRCECDFVGVRAKRTYEARIADLEAEVERLRADGERLTYIIDQHGSGADLGVMDRIANIAAAICPLVSKEADDIQKWYRAAADAAMDAKP